MISKLLQITLISSALLSNAALAQPMTINEIHNKHESSYNFSNWKSPIVCHYVEYDFDNQTKNTYLFEAKLQNNTPQIKFIKLNNTNKLPNIGNWDTTTWKPKPSASSSSFKDRTIAQKKFSNSIFDSNQSSPISISRVNDKQYQFKYNTAREQKTVVILPYGFYYTINGTLYMNGC